MASSVSIVNRALVAVRGTTITSLNENSEDARQANALFDDSLDYLLTIHPWNFSTYRTTLARLSTTPDWGWSYEYQLPVNPYCLKVEKVYTDIDYSIEGRKLLADETSVKIKYIGRVTDMNQLPPTFREAFSYYLASLFAGSLVGEAGLQSNMERKFLWTLNKAKVRDAQEGTPQVRANGSWVDNRGS